VHDFEIWHVLTAIIYSYIAFMLLQVLNNQTATVIQARSAFIRLSKNLNYMALLSAPHDLAKHVNPTTSF
jgi:hypothetical protein